MSKIVGLATLNSPTQPYRLSVGLNVINSFY